MCSKSKTDAVELVKAKRLADKWLTRPEALAVIRDLTGCSQAEAEVVLDQFKEDMPDGWKTTALN